MSARRQTLPSLLLASLSTLLATQGLADEEVSDQRIESTYVRGLSLQRENVGATKTPRPLIDTPLSISIVTAERIKEQGIDSIGDIVEYTPGVTTSQGEGHRDAIVFRGIRSTADFYIDGARDDVQYYRGLYNIEQVEILRGANALLFGRGGTGGVLNRVAKKAQLGSAFVGYTGGVDTFGAFNGAIDANINLNEQSAFRINASYEKLDNHRDFFDGERIGLNPTFRYVIADNTTIDLSYEYADHERFVDRGIPSGDNNRPVQALDNITFGDPDNNFNDLEAHILRARVEHQFSDNVVGNFSAYYGDFDKVYANFFPVGFNEQDFTVDLDGYIDFTERENLILSNTLVAEFNFGGVNHTLLVGSEYIDTASDQFRFNSFFDTNGDDVETFPVSRPLAFRNGSGVNADGVLATSNFETDLNDNTEVDIEVVSFFVQDEIEITEHFDIIIGARFDRFDIDVLNLATSNADEINRSRVDEEVSPRIGLVYKPQENISFYASFSESFLPRSGEQFANINGDNDDLDPNTFENLEGGLKWDVNKNLSLTLAVYALEQSSPQVNDADPNTFDVIDTDTTGVEVQLQGQLLDGWYVSAGYSYIDSEIVDNLGDTGLRPRELPENQLSLWNRIQASPKLGFGLGMTFQDESFAANASRGTLSSDRVVVPSFTRFDAAAYYDIRKDLRVQLNVENLFDREYFPNSHTSDNISVGAPINARLTVSGSF